MIESCVNSSDLENETGIRLAAIYDHEEVGSESTQGAASALTEQVLRRLSDPHKFELAMARSYLVSADQAHAVHPNYADSHEENHRPAIHGGVVLKYNGNQRYFSTTFFSNFNKLIMFNLQQDMQQIQYQQV